MQNLDDMKIPPAAGPNITPMGSHPSLHASLALESILKQLHSMSQSLNSVKGGYIGDSIGDYIRGDARSLDYGSHNINW